MKTPPERVAVPDASAKTIVLELHGFVSEPFSEIRRKGWNSGEDERLVADVGDSCRLRAIAACAANICAGIVISDPETFTNTIRLLVQSGCRGFLKDR